MSATTSKHFASAIASGTNWRDASKSVLEQLENIRTDGDDFNFGFLYVSDYLADDLTSIVNLFHSVLDIENWVGSIGLGVCGAGDEYIDTPAISAMIGHFDDDDFCIFPALTTQSEDSDAALTPWLDKNEPMMILTHGDPMMEVSHEHALQHLDQLTGGYIVGGFSSGRTHHYQITGSELQQNGLSGAAFSQNVNVATMLSQGCTQIGPTHTVTSSVDQTMLELDGEKALDVFENDIRIMTIKKTDLDPDKITIQGDDFKTKEEIPPEVQSLLKGEILAAIPVSESDQGDFLVRNIMGINEEERAIDIAHDLAKNDRVVFVHRDDETVRNDLSKRLLDMRERVQKDHGAFEPKAGIYISCVARAFSDFDDDENAPSNLDKADGSQSKPDHIQKSGEMTLIKEIIGDIPMTGFYAAGEINAGRLYGYTGILILFL